MRSTALRVLRNGIDGAPAPWRALGGRVAPLAQALDGLHLGPSQRMQARMAALMPVAVVTLALFWALSGLIGLIRIDVAAQTLTAVGWPVGLAQLSVGFWALVDIALAAALLWRPTARLACVGMVAVSCLYLLMASLVTPGLWLDPLGPLVKVLPGIALALLGRALLEDR